MAKNASSRAIEDLLAVAGGLQALFYGTLEALEHSGLLKGVCPHNEIPWVTMTIFLGCVLPKTLGRMTAGKIWEILSNKVTPKLP